MQKQSNTRILVIGGYGIFGQRLVASLTHYEGYDLWVAGRSLAKATALKARLNKEMGKEIGIVVLDIFSDQLSNSISGCDPDIVVNTSGPFQAQYNKNQSSENQYSQGKQYAVAKVCLEQGRHYIDLADDRQFVSQFKERFDTKAQRKAIVMVTGASSVPSLSDAVIRNFISRFAALDTINFGISPGNHTERGKGTVASILSYAGQPFKTVINGHCQSVYGWQGLSRYDFGPPIGKRWVCNCNIPDLELLPDLYPQLKNIRFKAGLELSLLHGGLWLLSFISRWGLVKNWQRYTNILIRMSEWFIRFGSSTGGMYVDLIGTNKQQKPLKIQWQLIAQDGTGPNVPVIATELIIQKIVAEKIQPGATPCVGLFNLEEFFAIAEPKGISQKMKEVQGKEVQGKEAQGKEEQVKQAQGKQLNKKGRVGK
jgi:hypothetical protein